MDNLKIDRSGYTLVDQVEEKLIGYFKEQGLRPGDGIPNENELSAALGIGRTVLREALSRFKMTGMIQSRTKRGMTLAEPSLLASLRRSINPLLMGTTTLRDIFEMRVALELGTSYMVFNRITSEHIGELEKIVEEEERTEAGFHCPEKVNFHCKLYHIIDNGMISEFLQAVLPALNYAVEQNRPLFEARLREQQERGQAVSHRDLLRFIAQGDRTGYYEAMVRHFDVYREYLDGGRTETDATNLLPCEE